MKLPAAVLAAVLAVAALAAAPPAAAAPRAAAACTPDVVTAYHDVNTVLIRVFRSCGHEYAAWGNWGGSDIDTGKFRDTAGFAHACDISACVRHPDGPLAEGGWQEQGFPRHCSFGCGQVVNP